MSLVKSWRGPRLPLPIPLLCSSIKGDLNPVWPEIFTAEYNEAVQWMPVKVQIFDKNSKGGERLMGEVEFEVTGVMKAKENGKEQIIPVTTGGSVIVHVQESIQGPQTGFLTCQLRALDLKNTDSGFLGLGAIDPFFELSRKYFDADEGYTGWHLVHRSQHVSDTINPLWEEFTIDFERLCSGNLDSSIKITLLNYEQNCQHATLGFCEMTVKQLLVNVSRRGNADRNSGLALKAPDTDEDVTGLLIVLKADIKP